MSIGVKASEKNSNSFHTEARNSEKFTLLSLLAINYSYLLKCRLCSCMLWAKTHTLEHAHHSTNAFEQHAESRFWKLAIKTSWNKWQFLKPGTMLCKYNSTQIRTHINLKCLKFWSIQNKQMHTLPHDAPWKVVSLQRGDAVLCCETKYPKKKKNAH